MPRTRRTRSRSIAFTLVELLTVVFIISLLIAILVPSLGAARNAAKKSSSQGAVKAISGALEMFKNDYGKDFPLTNGYPPSFAHPPMTDNNNNPILSQQEAAQGRFPFHEQKPVVYGAHWLPAMLIGVDAQGYIPKKNVPADRRAEPWKWYASKDNPETPIAQRAPMYLDPNNLRLVRTVDLPGQPPENLSEPFPDCSLNEPGGCPTFELPVIVDAFEQPILYYAASTHGRPTNMVAARHHDENPYKDADEADGPQSKGPPFYFHQDNIGFTGTEDHKGWDFGNTRGDHPIRHPYPVAGDTPEEIVKDPKHENFASYIIDRKVYKTLRPSDGAENVPETAPLRPVNPDTYILLSPGVDGRWGTTDDIGNVPQWEE